MSIEQTCYCGDEFNDYQKEQINRSVCVLANDRFIKDERAYCVIHLPDDNKLDAFKPLFERLISNGQYNFYGIWFPAQVDLSGVIFKSYVDLKYASFNHPTSFEKTTFTKGCDFTCARFNAKISFRNSTFEKTPHPNSVRFYGAIFNSVVDFSDSTFADKVDFSNVKFLKGNISFDPNENFPRFVSSTSFSNAVFLEEAVFEKSVFGSPSSDINADSFSFFETRFEKQANFQKAVFENTAYFGKSIFKGFADFRETFVKSYVSFSETRFETWAKFSGANNDQASWQGETDFSGLIIDKPERIFVQSVSLSPDSFKNTDLRKFDFSNVKWERKSFALDWSRFKDVGRFWKTEANRRKGDYEVLETVYRRIATNEEENSRYSQASDFRFTAFEIQRLKNPAGRLPLNLLWWYKWTSRYGENWLWAAVILAIVVFGAFPYAYSNTAFQVCPIERSVAKALDEGTCSIRQLEFAEATRQSLATATFQNVEHRKPFSSSAEIWSLLERIIAPLQAALVALAIRRKFMR